MKQLSILTLLALCAFTSCKHHGHGSTDGHGESFISIDSANKMLGSYLGSLDTANDSNLHSLIIDANDLRDYLNSEEGLSVSHMKIMFAHKLSYINAGKGNIPCGYKNNGLTVILAGYNSDNNYIYFGGKIMNMAHPCPMDCPQSGTASSDLLERK